MKYQVNFFESCADEAVSINDGAGNTYLDIDDAIYVLGGPSRDLSYLQ